MDQMNRKNIVKYFETLFNDPIDLINAMHSSDSILSGSRALDFFVPGMTDDDSDWDFYVYENTDKRDIMVKCLERQGVEWNSIGWVSGYSKNNDVSTTTPRILWSSNVKELEYRTMNGQINRNDKKTNVQLIWMIDRSPFSCLLEYHSSIVQCFITSMYAVCMYGRETMNKEAYHWKGNYSTIDGESDIIIKYKRRGIKYIANPHLNRHLRYVGDNNCIIIDLSGKDLSGSNVTLLNNLKWYEMKNGDGSCWTFEYDDTYEKTSDS